MKYRATVAVAAVAACLFASAANAEIKTRWIDYKQGETPLQGYLAYDDSLSGKRPGVLMLHRRDGMSDLTLENTQMYARQGYVVFAPDIFGKDVRPKTVPEMQAQTTIYTKDRPLMRARTRLALTFCAPIPWSIRRGSPLWAIASAAKWPSSLPRPARPSSVR
jgi:hypothetical protein